MIGISAVRTTTELLAAGWSEGAIRCAVRAGRLIKVRRGVYCEAEQWHRSGASVAERHAIEVCAAWLALGRRGWASGYSAALLLGLPVPRGVPATVECSLPRRPHGRRGYPRLRLRTASVRPADAVLAYGVPVTSAARTALDVARNYGFAAGLVLADAGVRAGMIAQRELREVMAPMAGWRGSRSARGVVDHASRCRESPAESLSYAVFIDVGLALPACNAWVVGPGSGGIRVDFLWRAHRLVGEVDGRVKYTDPWRVGADRVLVDEKERQLRVEEAGFVVVRWTGAEAAYRPAVVIDRIVRHARVAARMYGVPALRCALPHGTPNRTSEGVSGHF